MYRQGVVNGSKNLERFCDCDCGLLHLFNRCVAAGDKQRLGRGESGDWNKKGARWPLCHFLALAFFRASSVSFRRLMSRVRVTASYMSRTPTCSACADNKWNQGELW